MNFLNTSISKGKLLRNFKKLKNSFELVSFYYNDALKGFLNRPFFKKKRNQFLVAIIGFVLYFWYFLANVREIGRLGEGARGLDLETLTELTRITIMSYVNMCIILSVALFVFVNSIITFTKSSVYITNILPYSRREILVAQKIFKMGVALIGYEAILLLVFPLFGQLPIIKVSYQLMLLLLFHSIFVAIFSIMDALYAVLAKVVTKCTKLSVAPVLFVLDIFFTLFCAAYLVYFKIGIDTYIGKISIGLTELIMLMLLVSFITLIVVMFLSYKFALNIQEYKKLSYGLIRLPMIKLNLNTTFPAIYRHKSFVHSLALITIFSLIITYQLGVRSGLETLANLNSLIVFSAINYADATAKIRKYYNFFRVSLIEEVISLLFGGIILSIVPLVITVYLKGSMLPFFISMAIYLCAVIAGLLFPTTQGNLNETASTTTTVFLSIVLYLVLRNDSVYLSLAILAVLLLILSVFLAKERRY